MTPQTPDQLRYESQSDKQTALSLACIAVGLILSYGFRHFDASGMTNSLSGFLLGILLLAIGIAGFLVSGKQTIVVDRKARCITVEYMNPIRTAKRLIPFRDIVGAGIGYLGKRSNGVNFYYVTLKLRNGETYPLFAPGRFFDGGSDRAVMEDRRRLIEESLNRPAG